MTLIGLSLFALPTMLRVVFRVQIWQMRSIIVADLSLFMAARSATIGHVLLGSMVRLID